MEKWLRDVLPVMEVAHDCIASKQGDISLVFAVTLPELFTLSDEDYENLHQCWIKAIKLLPKGTILHKQDWYLQDHYQPPVVLEPAGLLARGSQRHFTGRDYLRHEGYLILTKQAPGRRPGSAVFTQLLRPALVPEQTVSAVALQEFEDMGGKFQQVLATGGIGLRRLRNEELSSEGRQAGLIERYCFLGASTRDPLLKDIVLKPALSVGDQSVQIFSLADAEDMPAFCGPRITYEKFSTDRTKFPVGFAASLGLLLPCNHLYNQFIVIGDVPATLRRLEKKRLRLQSLSAYSRENAIARDAVNDFLNECIADLRQPVKAHFHVLTWTDKPEERKNIRNLVTSALAQMDATAKQETVGAAQLFWAGIPGAAGDLPLHDTFDTFVEQACCFLAQETNYRSDPPETGIRFCDRLTGLPVYVDLFDLPRTTYGWTSNMGLLCCGSSGGGKSMTVNHILSSLYHQGAHCVTVDIGGSYRGLCELVGGYYFSYREDDPIRFNPFYLPEGETLDTEKKESLKALLTALWKQEDEHFRRSEYVALSNALQGYYQSLDSDRTLFPCFNTFYEYLENTYVHVLKDQKVKHQDFDVDNFLYVLRPYYKGGEFDYLLNATDNLDWLNQPFIVVELDNIKDNPILFPVTTLLLMEKFISKMRKLHGVRKVLMIDEAWKAITKSGMASFVQYAFKTIRKFNGIPGVISQEIDDLIHSPVIKEAIINNADIKILLDMKKFLHKFDKLQQTLGLSEKAKTILLSVNRDHREIFIDLGGQVAKVYRNELCPEEYYAYTTDGKERVKVLDYAQRYGSMEKGIEALVAGR